MQRSVHFLALLAGLAALLLCGGCDVQFPKQEVRFRHDPEADTLDVVFLYRGVSTEKFSEEALAKGKAVVDRVLGGRREFMLMDWPFNFDLDAEYEEGEGPPPEVQAAIDRVALVEVGAFLDTNQVLCGYQHFRMSGVAAALAEANRRLDEWAEELIFARGWGAEELEWWSDAEIELCRKFIEDDQRWLSLEAGRLMVRVPLSASGAARALEWFTRSLAGEDEETVEFTAMLLSSLTQLKVSEDLAEFTLGSVEGGDTVVRFHNPAITYSDALRDLVVEAGLNLEGAPTIDEVRALLGETVSER